ncbi:HAMP domain-containing protein [Motiliproteus coralliicola]|uniref:histidine kinase n=1 Tax=Motiliproteus coralliicola TaxID=2283196 RepID=A0A369WCV0_9GAMM|nr:ATP-binding protein [Motiliproteus coralliicola]RDE18436.1 HAMP domain-containing protein [Motiliproteus coralliicola]
MGRFFWKIFLWFLASLLSLSALLYGLALYKLSDDSNQNHIVERLLQQRVEAVAIALSYGGKAALQEYQQNVGRVLPRIWVLDQNNHDLLGRPVPAAILALEADQMITRQVKSTEGVRYQLRVYNPPQRLTDRFLPRTQPFRHRLPSAERLSLFVLVGALACAWLAWYLTRPIRILSRGTRALARGELDRAIAPQLGSRKDELVSLAQDFDKMALSLHNRQQALQQLLNDISHELRSPLTRIRLQFALLEKHQQPINETDSQALGQELDRLDELIDQVLTLARLDAESHYPLDDFIDLAGLLSAICQQAQSEAQAKGCRIECDLPDNEIVISANKELLRRAFENIIRNAVKYNPDHGQVRVNLKQQPGQRLSIMIQDQGPGVEEAQLAAIFSPFFRFDSSRPKGGYGLGLAIAQRAILRHGGTIVASNISGGGLAVHIELPFAPSRLED